MGAELLFVFSFLDVQGRQYLIELAKCCALGKPLQSAGKNGIQAHMIPTSPSTEL